ncbi:MAG: family 10 glycosylhydrolase [Clostridia bacterium]|nr:family 10 glycosylhydrolase [Clostridia bacterium]
MKKFLSLLLVLTMLLSFAACGDGDSSDSSSVDESVEASSTDASEDVSAGDDSSSEPVVDNKEKFDEDGKYIPLNYETVVLEKVTQFCFRDPGLLIGEDGKLRPKEEVEEVADTMMKNIKADGCNTVLMQMRPNGDSFYESEFFPLSNFVTGDFAVQELEYDIVEIFISAAHRYELSFQAWFNPMRNMARSAIEAIPENEHFVIQDWAAGFDDPESPYYQYVFEEVDGRGDLRFYLNIGEQDTRDLIVNGVREIIQKYNVDGVFMDDYFYPSGVASNFDIDSVAVAEAGVRLIPKWRRENVNKLVKAIYSMVKEEDERLIYGISPNGNISYAYETECADIYTWCSKEGYVDVMYPQFYYGMQHMQTAIDDLTKLWEETITLDSVKLVPVLSLHKSGGIDQWAMSPLANREWIDYTDVILQSLTYLLTTDDAKLDGIGIYCYDYLHGTMYDDATRGANIKKEIENYNILWMNFEALLKAEDDTAIRAAFTEAGLDYDAKLREWDDNIFSVRTERVFFPEEVIK